MLALEGSCWVVEECRRVGEGCRRVVEMPALEGSCWAVEEYRRVEEGRRRVAEGTRSLPTLSDSPLRLRNQQHQDHISQLLHCLGTSEETYKLYVEPSDRAH